MNLQFSGEAPAVPMREEYETDNDFRTAIRNYIDRATYPDESTWKDAMAKYRIVQTEMQTKMLQKGDPVLVASRKIIEQQSGKKDQQLADTFFHRNWLWIAGGAGLAYMVLGRKKKRRATAAA